MEGFEIFIAVITIVAAVLFLISMTAYKRERSPRFILAVVIFALYLIKGLVMSVSIFTGTSEQLSQSASFHLIFDVLILFFLFFAVLRSPKNQELAGSNPEDIG